MHLQAVGVLKSHCGGFCVARGHLTAIQWPQPDSHLHYGNTRCACSSHRDGPPGLARHAPHN